MSNVYSSNLGYPRLGDRREWKRTLESFWAGKMEESVFLEEMKQIRLARLQKQKDKGIDWIPVGDFTYYDHILDTAVMFGLIPKRFSYDGGPVPLSTYFAIARGTDSAEASEMTKWWNTNYHYIVPELDEVEPVLTENRPLLAYKEAKEQLQIDGKPVIVGPYTLLKCAKGYDPASLGEWLDKFIPLYSQILLELVQAGAEWVQIDEPALVTATDQAEIAHVRKVYEQLQAHVPGLKIMLQTYFEAVSFYNEVVQFPVAGIGLDFIHGKNGNLEALKQYSFPEDKVLGVGLIDGRNVWRGDLNEKLQFLYDLQTKISPQSWVIQPSCSLLHVPVTAAVEDQLPEGLLEALAFADEKLEETTELKAAFASKSQSLPSLPNYGFRVSKQSKSEQSEQNKLRSKRAKSFQDRQQLQAEKWALPVLPTTTIGSFPQTAEVRRARRLWRKGEWSDEKYENFIKAQIDKWIQIQEDIGLDVLVHGEFERTDMVEFFGEKLNGFAFTQLGWVQSYGSRCVRPPIIYGDVEFDQPMTVKETKYAQSKTDKPVKGMLTGPVTILNWSFVRDDLPRFEVCFQIAGALAEEVLALEEAGIEMIQVDEPALREGLPLKQDDWEQYLNWAVEAFRRATSVVRDTTQIHTHMCYSQFNDIIESIHNLDADVISIETSRSHGELISTFEEYHYDQGIGLGIYDIHSPRVPEKEEMKRNMERALRVLPKQLFWINPDCGLKTRDEAETIAALENMVAAALEMRAELE